MTTSYVCDAVRTPFGRHGKSLAGVRPDDLAARSIELLLARHPELDPALIDDVILGDANQAGEDNRNVARMASLLAGLPTSVPGTTVNRPCGSSIESIIQASRAIESGDATLVLAGGVKSMSRAPWVATKPDRAYSTASQEMFSTTIGWRMTNPVMDARWTISNGESAELLADRFGISRDEQDEFAVRSHYKAAAAWDAGLYPEVIPVPDTTLTRDEGIRADATVELLATLKPAFRSDGTVTAGNSSPLNDGASWTSSNSTRPSRRSPSPVSAYGRSSTPSTSTYTVEHSRSGIHLAHRADASSATSPTSSSAAAEASASPQSASASARGSRSCSRRSYHCTAD